MPAPLPPDEQDRLAALRELMVLGSAPEPIFDAIARLAAALCATPIALLSLVDERRQWFKANVGLHGITETPRATAFCAHAILGDATCIVPDAASDERFAANPLVLGSPHIRFYAGAPLFVDGARVGTLCVIDRVPRELSRHQTESLRALAGIAAEALTMRRKQLAAVSSASTAYERAIAESEATYRSIVEEQAELISLARADGELVYVNRAYARHFGHLPVEMIGANLFDFVDPGDRPYVKARLDAAWSSGSTATSENRMVAADGSARWVAWTNSIQLDARKQPLLHSVGRDIHQRKMAEEALRASQDFLSRTGRVAGVGGWELDIARGTLNWSPETRRIHEVEPDYVPTLDHAIAFYAPQARADIARAVESGIASGQAWDLELPLVTARGRQIWVRAVGEAEYEDGKAVRLVGAFQDITERKALQDRVAEGERFLRQITDNMPALVSYIDADERFRFANRAYEDWLGIAPAALHGRLLREVYGEITYERIRPHVQRALAGERVSYEREFDSAFGRRDVQVMLVPDTGPAGRITGLHVLITDMTDRKRAEYELRQSESRMRLMTDALPMRIAFVDADERYRFNNLAYQRIFGMRPEELYGKPVREVLGVDAYNDIEPWMRRALRGEAVTFSSEMITVDTVRHFEASYIPQFDEDGTTVLGFHAVVADVTSSKLEERRLLDLTQRDALTGVANRIGFHKQLARALQDFRDTGSLTGVMYLDVDRFKSINDTQGHAVGDQLLKAFAHRLVRTLRLSDTIARLGGDEFAILLERLRTPEHLGATAEKILLAMREPFLVDGLRLDISTSIGLALADQDASTADALLNLADRNLYRAKAAGRNTWRGPVDPAPALLANGLE